MKQEQYKNKWFIHVISVSLSLNEPLNWRVSAEYRPTAGTADVWNRIRGAMQLMGVRN